MALAGSNRGISVSVLPIASTVFMMQLWPKLWNNGNTASRTSSCCRGSSISSGSTRAW